MLTLWPQEWKKERVSNIKKWLSYIRFINNVLFIFININYIIDYVPVYTLDFYPIIRYGFYGL